MRLARNQRGSVLVEYVVCFLLLLLLWAGVCNCGLLLKERLAVAAAVREAGREAAVRGDPYAGVEKGYQVLQAAGIPRDRVQVNVYHRASNLVAAEVTCRSPVFLPLMGAMVGSSWANEITLHDVKFFRSERTPGG